jgi:hypothetical protein
MAEVERLCDEVLMMKAGKIGVVPAALLAIPFFDFSIFALGYAVFLRAFRHARERGTFLHAGE